MHARWLPLLALILAAPAHADAPDYQTLQGSWALQVGGKTIFRFDLTQDEAGKWHAAWSKPATFASDGNRFSRLSGPIKKVRSMTAIDTPDGIELSFDDPTPGAVPDIFDFKPIDEDAVEMTYVGTGLAPYTLDRVKPDTPLGPWEKDAIYSRDGAPPVAKAAGQAEIDPEPVLAQPAATEAPPPPDPSTFRLKAGAPVGR